MVVQNYRELIVWQKAMRAVTLMYSLTKKLPAEERFGLKSQMERAAVSIAANIAEGYGRSHRGDYLRFLSFAKGSLCECETYLILCSELAFVNENDTADCWNMLQEVGKMLTSMIASLSPTP